MPDDDALYFAWRSDLVQAASTVPARSWAEFDA
jgi:hypothetical protein